MPSRRTRPSRLTLLTLLTPFAGRAMAATATCGLSPNGALRPHLRQPIHIHGGALTFGLGLEGREQLDGPCEITLDRGCRGSVVETPDFRKGIHRVLSFQASAISQSARIGLMSLPDADR